MPSLKISNGVLEDEIVTESAIVSTFVADLFPNSSFWPPSRESPTSALTRARITFFADTFIGKVQSKLYPVLKAEGEEKEKLGAEVVEAIRKEIEPLLEGAGPFFGGSKSITLAEVRAENYVQSSRKGVADGLSGFTGFDSAIRDPIPGTRRDGFNAEKRAEGP